MADSLMHGERICSICKIKKPIEAYSKNKNCTGGRLPNCKECRNAARKAERVANPDKHRQESKNWRVRNRQKWLEGRKRRRAEWSEEQRERHLEMMRNWCRANPDRMKANKRAYIERDPERYRVLRCQQAAKRWSLKRSAGDLPVQSLLLAKLESQGRKCLYCDEDLDHFELDHYIPLARGGSNDIDNIVMACKPCNMRKWAKMPWEFMPERFNAPCKVA